MEFLQNISFGGWAVIVTALLSLIQISPIKIDPWSWLGREIGRFVNAEVIAKQDQFQKESQEYRKKNDIQIKKINDKIDRIPAETARINILRFGDEIKNHVQHSEEYYNQILADITEYEKYCHAHPDFKNERTVATEKVIRSNYEEHLKNNDFL